MSVTTVLSPQDKFVKAKRFAWDGRLFTTVPEFEAYLADPSVRTAILRWAKRVTVHHTWKPTVVSWQQSSGADNLRGLVRTWRDDNGWTTGPNMIIAPEGIYLASGILAPGIHATVCNADGIGIEIVGNYDYGYWREPILSYVFGTVVALAHALGMTPETVVKLKRVNGHRECNSPKTCPGNVIDLDKFRRDVATRMTITPQTDNMVIGVPPSITKAQFKLYAYKYGAPIVAGELDRIYDMAVWLEIDPAFLLALWKQEAFVDDPTDNKPGTAVIGGSELQRQTHQPLNIVTNDAARAHVKYKDRMWEKSSTWQIGLMKALLHLKDTHGANGRLSVRQIVPVHAPASDGNDVETIISNVHKRMAEMKTL